MSRVAVQVNEIGTFKVGSKLKPQVAHMSHVGAAVKEIGSFKVGSKLL